MTPGPGGRAAGFAASSRLWSRPCRLSEQVGRLGEVILYHLGSDAGFSHCAVSEMDVTYRSNLTDGLFLVENVLLYPAISGLSESREYGVIIFISIISLFDPFILGW